MVSRQLNSRSTREGKKRGWRTLQAAHSLERERKALVPESRERPRGSKSGREQKADPLLFHQSPITAIERKGPLNLAGAPFLSPLVARESLTRIDLGVSDDSSLPTRVDFYHTLISSSTTFPPSDN